MSEDMPDRLPERLSEYILPEGVTSRWHVRNYVRIMDEGMDHSQKLFSWLFQTIQQVVRDRFLLMALHPVPQLPNLAKEPSALL